MASLPTIKIVDPKNSKDYVNINAEDFDAKKHTRWDERDQKTKAAEKKPEASASSSTKKSADKSD